MNFVANRKNCFLLKILSREPSFLKILLYSILYVGELVHRRVDRNSVNQSGLLNILIDKHQIWIIYLPKLVFS